MKLQHSNLKLYKRIWNRRKRAGLSTSGVGDLSKEEADMEEAEWLQSKKLSRELNYRATVTLNEKRKELKKEIKAMKYKTIIEKKLLTIKLRRERNIDIKARARTAMLRRQDRELVFNAQALEDIKKPYKIDPALYAGG